MGSTFQNFSGQKVKGFMGKEYALPVYLQFVPGYCVDAIHSQESYGYKGEQTINTIYAVSHIPSNSGKRRQQYYSEDNRYFPLLRNHGDVPTKGDPVLLCTIGKINYYLGPLNTINNSPTWNDDKNYKKELTIGTSDMLQNTLRGERGESLAFNKDVEYNRLQKVRLPNLDYGEGDVINETTGDYMIEGRHGNSIRVGSRSNNPYVFISNQRNDNNVFETLGDGSLITITSKGTLAQHFPFHITDDDTPVLGFTLASDTVDPNPNPIGTVQSFLNNNADIQTTIYGYGNNNNENQILLHSDRITLNSKRDDIFISSLKDIHIGSGENLTISTNKQLIISSTTTKLGKDAKEPMVKGNELVTLLKKIVDILPLLVATPNVGGPLQIPATQYNNIVDTIDDFLSSKHFIDK
tara:strand:- start:1610 stop:2836 length:1227 start_codon:yes stop_codon:yes gene_type:complete